MLELLKITGKVQRMMVMKSLACSPYTTPAEVYENLKLNGITGINYPKTYQLVSMLEYDELADVKDGMFALNKAGEEELKCLERDLKKAMDIISDFKTNKAQDSMGPGTVELPEIYRNCPEVKIIPYSEKSLKCEEREFFNKVLTNERNHVFTFDSRGLGKNVAKGSLVVFQNNNLIKYVAVLDSYISDNGIKEMVLISDSIHELAVPITMKDMGSVRESFKFAQNIQTIKDENEVAALEELVRCKW